MSNVILKMTAMSNITYNNEYDTGITVEEWAEMTPEERVEVMQEALWDDIDVTPTDEETGEYL